MTADELKKRGYDAAELFTVLVKLDRAQTNFLAGLIAGTIAKALADDAARLPSDLAPPRIPEA